MDAIYFSAMMGLDRGGRLISQAEHIINDAIESGTAVYVENPDGTKIRLQEGVKIHSYEAVIIEGNKCEKINFNY